MSAVLTHDQPAPFGTPLNVHGVEHARGVVLVVVVAQSHACVVVVVLVVVDVHATGEGAGSP